MNVSVILVAYYSDQWLPDCIASLVEASNDRLQLVLVDNTGNTAIDSIDFTSFNCEILKTPKVMGFAEANNFAIVNATTLYDTLLFLNQDTLSEVKWISSCLDTFKSRPDVGAITPLTATYDWKEWDPYFLECTRKSVDFCKQWDNKQELKEFYELPVIPAAAMLVRTEVLKKTGPFDPIYGSYYEDYDLCRRIREVGYKVGVCTRAKVAHFSGSSTNSKQSEDRRARWVTRNRLIYMLRKSKGSRPLDFIKYLCKTFPRNFLRSLFGRPSAKPFFPFLQAHFDMLSLLPRLVSEKHDKNKWEAYLTSISWPPKDLTGPANLG